MGDIFCWFKISQEFCLRCWFFWNRDVGWALSPARRLGLRWFPTLRWLFARAWQASVYENVVNGLGKRILLLLAPHRRWQRQLLRGELKCCQGNLKATWKTDWTNDRISWNFLLSAAWMWTFRSLAPAMGCSDWNSQGLKHEPAAKESIYIYIYIYIYNQIKSISFFVPLLRQRITKRCVAVDHHLVFLNIPWQVLARSAAQWSWPTSRPRSNVAAVEDEEKHGHFQRASRWPWTRDAGEGIQRCPG